MEKLEKIELEDNETGEKVSFYVLEETVIGEKTYLLAADKEDLEEALCTVFLRKGESQEDFIFEALPYDAPETAAVLSVFEEIMEDVSFE